MRKFKVGDKVQLDWNKDDNDDPGVVTGHTSFGYEVLWRGRSGSTAWEPDQLRLISRCQVECLTIEEALNLLSEAQHYEAAMFLEKEIQARLTIKDPEYSEYARLYEKFNGMKPKGD